MVYTLLIHLTLLVSPALVTGQSLCDAVEGWCSYDMPSPLTDGESLSMVQLRASRKIYPQKLAKICPHKCTIKDLKSGRRLYATNNMDPESGAEGSGEDNIGAIAEGSIEENQKWFIDIAVNDSYVIKNAASSRRLYASLGKEGEEGIGALEVLPIWEDQQWFIDGNADGHFVLKNFYSDRCLYAVKGKTGKDGFGAGGCDPSANVQKWIIEPDEAPTASADLGKEDAYAVPFGWTYTPSPDSVTANASQFGPNKWALTPGGEACGEEGTQSPIDIVFNIAISRDHEKVKDLTLQTEGDCPAPAYMLNEHTAEVDYSTEGCDKALKATWLGREYYLTKFNYRSPSEHTWDGGYFPMEVHHVHKDDAGEALVIAVMVAEAHDDQDHIGNVPAMFLSNVLSKMPHPTKDKSADRFVVIKKTNRWNPYISFIPMMTHGFVIYSGSMTTPPCTSGTIWIFSKKAVNVPASTITMYRELINSNRPNQLATFGTIVNASDANKIPPWNPMANVTVWDSSLECNNRPIQPLVGVNNPARVIDKVLPGAAVPVAAD